ncbi:hypothetical protein PanWU01x14_192000 [Parasponia andersonii]|uniref:Uncharacterized protein n=1 Tax=Parasponia andersonii TaxID=3476 RepID=A0A2P5C1D6_PARAD|nr:hypothetical protein PanWU01x14_192000 [Parasponia andersonii]
MNKHEDFKKKENVPQLVSTFELPRESDGGLGSEERGGEEHRTCMSVVKTQPKIDDMITKLSGEDTAACD